MHSVRSGLGVTHCALVHDRMQDLTLATPNRPRALPLRVLLAMPTSWVPKFHQPHSPCLLALPPAVRNDRAVATVAVLFTDIEGSTNHLQRLGQARWLEHLRGYETLVHEQLAAHGGVEVKALGDGNTEMLTTALGPPGPFPDSFVPSPSHQTATHQAERAQ
jgi:class 3 adenylate cyclase